NDVGTRYDAFELMGVKRKQASDELERKVTEILAPKGITVDGADFLGHYANQQVDQRIVQRVNALTELELSKIRSKIAQIQPQTDVVRDQAHAQAQQIAGNQTNARSIEMLKLESDLAWLEKWDGQMPVVQPKPGQSLILSGDFLKSLEGREGRQ